MFSKKEAIKFGWDIAKKHFWFFILILLTSFFIQYIPSILQSIAGKNQPIAIVLVLALISLTAGIFKLIVDIGIIRITLKFVDNQGVTFGDLFNSYGYFWKYLGGFILYSLIVAGGMIFLIIPGIIWAIRFQYYNYFIADKGLGPIEALKQSWKTTRGNAWNLFVFGSLLGLLNIAGALLLIVGLLFTIPTTFVAAAYIFRKLQTADISDQTIGTGKIFLLASLGLLMFIVPVVAIILLVNPSELTRKARDAGRFSDLANLQQLINQVQIADAQLCPNSQSYCEGRSDKDSRDPNGIGWVKVPLMGVANLPIDPSNSSNYFYRYCSNGKDWEIETRIESKSLAMKAQTDNGDDPNLYEVGSDLTICRSSLPI